jgi:hypothetical protein
MATKAEKKAAQEYQEFLNGLMAQHGVPNPEAELVVEHGEPLKAEELDDSPQMVMFRAQGILRSMDCPTEIRLTRICKNEDCGDVFATNYASVAYCSTVCCEYSLKKHFGLAWKPNSRIKKERWEIRTEPEIISMRALQAMKMIVDRVESDLGYPIPIEQEAFSRVPSGLLKETKSPAASELPLVSEPLPVLPQVSDSPKIPAPLEYSFEEEDDLLGALFASSD